MSPRESVFAAVLFVGSVLGAAGCTVAFLVFCLNYSFWQGVFAPLAVFFACIVWFIENVVDEHKGQP